jgi:Fungal specific transcription factor domain.
MGELSTTIFAYGLHQESTNAPFFLREMRNRVMVAAYTIDKALATFLGRPPLISWRYCDIPMPLDLSWDEISAEPPIRDVAIANLNTDGWNKNGTLHMGTWARLSFLTSVIREKILELSLGRHTEGLSKQIE